MVAAHAHPGIVASDVIDAAGDGFSEFGIGKIANIDLLGLALRTPFAAGVFELSDEFFFLGIDADDRLIFAQKRGGFFVDVDKLGVAAPMGLGFGGGEGSDLPLVHERAHEHESLLNRSKQGCQSDHASLVAELENMSISGRFLGVILVVKNHALHFSPSSSLSDLGMNMV